ncbi:uncharacterized protein LOC129729526 [Wyeomyia smithii]|uniref:uncharacterized protein LOC129729526 n=1 Tax=Wyeomyia smithii TaxID=174621 RepID=UPI002467B291|nr:uncharacterized protein LOC129729526 [Wyeomyia smithii]
MFQIIKTGRNKMQELHYLDYPPKEADSPTPPPSAVMIRTNFNNSPGTKRQFVKVNEEMFVQEIKKRPILYNTTMKDHKRFSTRHEAWSEVATAMNLSEQECKKRWRSLRDAFMKVVRNKNEEEQKTWVHYRLLEFLLPYIGKKGKRSREIECLEGFDNDDEDTEYVEFEEEICKNSREPITVSYVTEDGQEVFQMLQDPDTIPEGAVIGIETEDEDELEENDMLHDTDAYEERLDSTMLDLHTSYETSGQQSHLRDIKQESFCDGDGSEIHIEEIEMDSVISEEHNVDGDEKTKNTKIVHENHTDFTSTDHLLDKSNVCAIVSQEDTALSMANLDARVNLASTQAPAHSIPEPQPVRVKTPVNTSCTTVQREAESNTRTSDSDEKFLLSCAPILRRLPNKKNQLARLKIQQLLFELEYDEKYNS